MNFTLLLIRRLFLFLMAPSQGDFTTRTRVDDSMQFASEGVGVGFFCYVDFVTFYFVRTGYFHYYLYATSTHFIQT